MSDKKIKLVAIQGSARSENSCPDQNSKTSKLLKYVVGKLPKNVEVDIIDLSVQTSKPIVMPCRSCLSTAGGYHCHYKCDCYSKEHDKMDLMSQEDVYERMEKCDGFFVFTPINWGQPSSVVKSFFDRLVCINLTITHEEAKKLLNGDIKNAKKTRELAKSGKYNKLLKNHWQGKFAAFFCQGDNGANDYREYNKKDLSLPLFPDSYKKWSEDQPKNNKWEPASAVKDLVYQCVYSGIYVPSDCVDGMVINHGLDYATANDRTAGNVELYTRAKKVVDNLIKHIQNEN